MSNSLGIDFLDMIPQALIRCVNLFTQFSIKLSQFHSYSVFSFVLIEIGILCDSFLHVSHLNTTGATVSRTMFVPQVFCAFQACLSYCKGSHMFHTALELYVLMHLRVSAHSFQQLCHKYHSSQVSCTF